MTDLLKVTEGVRPGELYYIAAKSNVGKSIMKEYQLNFVAKEGIPNARQAILFFPNGYGASVIQGPLFYTDDEHPFELAVIEGTEEDCHITYDTPVTHDVMGFLTHSNVMVILKAIEALPSCPYRG